jgi:hypothetical protein
MAIYVISYDLRSSGQDYSGFYDAVEKCGKCIKPLESFFLVNSSKSASQIRDTLKEVVDRNDRIIVLKLSGEAAWAGYPDKDGLIIKNFIEGK